MNILHLDSSVLGQNSASRALTAAKTISEGLVHAIAHEVAAQRNRGAAYGPTGGKPNPAAVTAVTLNQRA